MTNSWHGVLPVPASKPRKKWFGELPTPTERDPRQGWWGASFSPIAQASAVGLVPDNLRVDAIMSCPPAIATAVALSPNAYISYTGITAPIAIANATVLLPSNLTAGQLLSVPPAIANALGIPPIVRADTLLSATDYAIATGVVLPPEFYVHYLREVPVATASGILLPPTPFSDTLIGVSPADVAGAVALPPTVFWNQDPVTSEYQNNGSFNVSNARLWATHLVMVGVGGGEAGTNGNVITGRGGKNGAWNATIIALSAYPNLTSLNVVVGSGGGSNGANGSATTFTGVGQSFSLSCSGGSGGNQNIIFQGGLGPEDYNYDGVTYPGGGVVNGAPVGSGANGDPPGGGGAGGGIFASGGSGAKGRAWIKAKRVT